jgi:hypothetical protein
MNATDIPLPQDTQLYESVNNEILTPRLSVTNISGSTLLGSFNNPPFKQYKLNLYSQSVSEINISINDKSISSMRGGIYYNLNGFDYGFDYRFLNNQSPTVCFLPEIQAKDLDANVALNLVASNTYTISDYESVLSNSLLVNNLILLRNQTAASQNKVYRVQEVNGEQITVYDDSDDNWEDTGSGSINAALFQNQEYIFIRAKVVDLLGTFYYGMYNLAPNPDWRFWWVSQTQSVHLPKANYGVTLNSELARNELNYSIFSAQNLKPQINEVVAINIATNGNGSVGGKTSGLYSITKISNAKVYFQPIYPSVIFIHQFFKVEWDMDSLLSNQVWYVNPATVTNSNYLYSTVNFSFSKLDINSTTLSDPERWAKQGGGANDIVLGFTIYPNDVNNNFIKQSDSFYFEIRPPTWPDINVEGLSLKVNYETNILPVNQEVVA